MKRIKENEYFEVGGTIFQYLIIEGKHKLIPTKKVVKVSFNAPTLEEVILFFTSKGYTEVSAAKFYNYYSVNDWKDGKGNQVKSWKQKATGVWFVEQNKIPIITSNTNMVR